MCVREKVTEREEESMSQPFFLTSIFGYFDLLKYVYACVLIHVYINILTCVCEREKKKKGREYVETFLFDKYLWEFLFVEIYVCRYIYTYIYIYVDVCVRKRKRRRVD